MSTAVAADAGGEIRTRICILSDTHTIAPYPAQDRGHAYRHPLPPADVLLHAGDLTKVGLEAEHGAMVEMLKAAPAPLKLVIAGNHDITLDAAYYASPPGRLRHRTYGAQDVARIRALYTGEEARRHGIVYLEEGVRAFRLANGARLRVYASPYTPEFQQWAFAYDREEDRFHRPVQGTDETDGETTRPPEHHAIPSHPDVDVLLTHGPPSGILDRSAVGDVHVGCEHLLRAARRARPRLHCFGHIHEGYGAERRRWRAVEAEHTPEPVRSIPLDREAMHERRAMYVDVSGGSTTHAPLAVGQETLFVNASVVDVRYRPVNAPWVVDLDLPRDRPGSAQTEEGSPRA